jgi:hypothetical protein
MPGRKQVKNVITDTATFDALHELWEDVQRGNLMLAALCRKAGIDPAEAKRLPGEAPAEAVKAA